jgi:signal transduction histidine kinase
MGYWVYNNNNQIYINQKKEILNRFKTNYESVLSGYEKAANLFYTQVIESEKIMTILRQIPSSYGEKKNQLRDELYHKLLNNYTKLKEQNFRQLHFHLSTGESFLRFHRPNKYGDNLFPVRYSVEKTNKTLKKSTGFEEGRIFNGYRFVFPIMEEDKHYGSVELSISFKAISEGLKELENIQTSVLFKKETIESKVFENEKRNYIVCESLPEFVFDKVLAENPDQYETNQLINNMIAINRDIIESTIRLKYTTLIEIKYQNKNYLFISIPTPNVKGNQIGNILILYENNELSAIKNRIFLRLGIVLALYILILATFISIIKRDKKLVHSREQIKKSEADLLDSGEVKNKLFEIITHDLRNHFNAVNGFMDLLNRRLDHKNEKIEKLYNGLNDAIELTNNLMDNLYIWSRLQINKVELNKTTFDGSKWLIQEQKRFSNIIKRKDITISNQTKSPAYLNADPDMMKYIHQNILLNAIRYSNKGGKIVISIVDHGKHTTLNVKDEGKGMSSTEVSKIMNQENWYGTKTRGSSGLGLYVTRKLVAFHNGKINIDSAKGIGTTVTIEIPK